MTLKYARERRNFAFIFRHLPGAIYYTYLKRKPDIFIFRGTPYNYFYHLYNCTYLNERAVEIPIVWEMIQKYQGKKILEVGNVISHYFSYQHDILDKYEKGKNIINKDVAEYQSPERYDLIVSISTLEHVGWDEDIKNSGKILIAIQNLKNHLSFGGKMIITLPLGYNPEMDKLLEKNKINFTDKYYFKKDKLNKWKQVEQNDLLGIDYNRSLHSANGILIGVVQDKLCAE